MNLNYVYRQLRKRAELKHFEIKPIGSAIRLKRKELGMTLEEGAEGICSISYLSKLENNQIDPNLDFVDQLVDRFGLKDQIAFDIESYEQDLKELTKLMFHFEKPKRSYIDTYRDREDHQAMVIHVIETYLHEEHELVLERFKSIQQFIPHLRHDELTLILLSLASSLIAFEKYQDAYQLINHLPHLDKHEHFELYLLSKRIRLQLGLMMHKISEYGPDIHRYFNEVIEYGYHHLLVDMKKLAVLHIAYYQSPEKTHKAVLRVDRINEMNHLPYAISCYTHQRYESVIELARQKSDLSGWVLIYLLSLEATQNFDEMAHVISERLPNNLLPSELIIVDYMKIKYQKDQSKMISYIRKMYLNQSATSDHIMLLEYLMIDTAQIFIKSQFYKEANLLTQKFHLHLRSIKMAVNHHQNEG
jgi:transcriptional regulator with XRE-family HTH domain